MQIITDIFVGILVSYIGFTNMLAGHIGQWFPVSGDTETEMIEETEPDTMASVTTSLRIIPDILKQSAEYQLAATQAVPKTNLATQNPIDAIVNIFCTSTTRSQIRTTTGTGFFIHSEGVILTNAHVAQFLLLTKTDTLGKTECLVRTGNPATPSYHADLLYISPAWIVENASFISDASPMGTGERDYALLYITKSTNGLPLPTTFPALRTNTSLVPNSVIETSVIAAGYPAELLKGQGITNNLVPQQANTIVTELFTFGSNYADVLALGGSSVGQHGSSGGPITTTNGTAIGMITTKGDDVADGAGSLRGITLSYINRTIEEETGFPLEQAISGSLPYRAQVFADTMVPYLAQLITLTTTLNQLE